MGKSAERKDWASWIDEQIRDAQARGAFDNLPGKGKRLDLTPNPYAGDQELAFKILRDAGYAPEWIELDKAIRAKIQRARSILASACERHRDILASLADRSDSWAVEERRRAASGWQQAVASFEREVAAINREIDELNLKVPGSRFQRFKVDAAHEIACLEEGAV